MHDTLKGSSPTLGNWLQCQTVLLTERFFQSLTKICFPEIYVQFPTLWNKSGQVLTLFYVTSFQIFADI